MSRWLVLGCLAACTRGPDLTVTTSFVVSDVTGAGTSPLDALSGQPIDLEVVLDRTNAARGDVSDTPTCKTTIVADTEAVGTAHGATADLVTAQILDRLPSWELRFQLCDTVAESSITVHSEIDALNLAFGCGGLPGAAVVRDGNGFPEITSFTATHCHATILDVVNNRILSNSDFSIAIATGRDRVP